jgi:hypothetical protein
MIPSIFQADLVSVVPIQITVWLFGVALFYLFILYSQGGTAEADMNPIDLFLALLSGEPYDALPGVHRDTHPPGDGVQRF